MRSVVESYRGRRVRVFRLDRKACIARLRECAEGSLEHFPEVLEIRLFGSLARGEARPGSDADLLIVLQDSDCGFLERIARFLPQFTGLGLGCDLFPYTRDELARMRSEGNPLVQAANSDGLLLARR